MRGRCWRARRGSRGRSRRLADPGDYAIVIDNRDNDTAAANVRLTVSLDYGSGSGSGVRRLPAGRQLTVIALSFAVFFGIVGFSARKLWRNANGADARSRTGE